MSKIGTMVVGRLMRHGIIPLQMANQTTSKNRIGWLKKKIVPITGLLLVIAIMGSIIYVYLTNPLIFQEMQSWGYLGVFIISIILNATIILPVSNMAVIAALGATLPSPYVVGLAGGIGAAIGEMTGYLAGRSGRGLLAKSQAYNRLEAWVIRRGWIAVFILSVFPFAFDIVGITAGAMRMPAWRFFVACWLGRTITYTFVAKFASISWPVVAAIVVATVAVMIVIAIKAGKHPADSA